MLYVLRSHTPTAPIVPCSRDYRETMIKDLTNVPGLLNSTEYILKVIEKSLPELNARTLMTPHRARHSDETMERGVRNR